MCTATGRSPTHRHFHSTPTGTKNNLGGFALTGRVDSGMKKCLPERLWKVFYEERVFAGPRPHSRPPEVLLAMAKPMSITGRRFFEAILEEVREG